MFDFDNFREIWSTIKKNKLRTFLTGFSVSWGIFMLIVLLGAGNGLKNGVMYNFRDIGGNRVEVWTRYTSKPWRGNPTDRQIRFKQEDFDELEHNFPEVEYKSATIRQSSKMAYGEEYVAGKLEGIYPDFAKINFTEMYPGKGRFINDMDIRMRRKVVVLSPRMAEILFRDKDPLGQFVKCDDMMYRVVGIYHDENKSNDAPAFIPFSVAQQLYSKGYGFSSISFTVNGISTESQSEAFENRFRWKMAQRHNFDPEDKNAIAMWSTVKEFSTFDTMMNGIILFIWVVGLGTLTAGVVGVSNIMLITVRERTREFGIRKALGAKPSSILQLVIIESIMITAVFGYIGMVLGIGLTELINYGMEMAGVGVSTGSPGKRDFTPTIFRNPTVDLGISLMATGVLILAGVLAGYFPARKAVNVSAIEAMRTE